MIRIALVLAVIAGCAAERDLSGPCTDDCTAHVHPPGIVDPRSPDFHGAYLASHDWQFSICQGCHGDDFTGGAAKVSCLSCHPKGPTACETCHRDGPTSNAHRAHADNAVACGECHVVPASWDADGHLLHDGVAITAPPKIVFGARASATLDPADRKGPPSYDGATCRNVYCHGDALHAAGGSAPEPRWDDPAPVGQCTRCHASPPPSHQRADCATCHPSSAPHVDGVVQIGREPGCGGCHGSAASPAPPTDLAGNTFTTAIGVGAHQAHLQAPSRLSAPIACETCHDVPAAIASPGHLAPAPAVVHASVGWDRTEQTCANSCHGPSRPVWTQQGQVFCGSCHGLPPTDAPHTAAMTTRDCATCHPGTVDAFGNIRVDAGASEHLDGIVEHL